MAIVNEESLRNDQIKDIAGKMMVAARTAPKAKGRDNLEILCVDGDELKTLSKQMSKIAEREDIPFFDRDAANILQASAVVFIGTKIAVGGLKYCGLCGFENCNEKSKYPEVPCVFNTNDLGIAVGSAVAVAADNRVDNRTMYTAGMAALELGFFSGEVKIAFGIPLSASGKNPFFDRK